MKFFVSFIKYIDRMHDMLEILSSILQIIKFYKSIIHDILAAWNTECDSTDENHYAKVKAIVDILMICQR